MEAKSFKRSIGGIASLETLQTSCGVEATSYVCEWWIEKVKARGVK
jgi:hypothetical protein